MDKGDQAEPVREELLCESCGKNMMTQTGETLVGLRYTLTIDEGTTEDELELYKKQWGKYFNPGGVEIHLCMECFIDSAFASYNPYL